MWKVFSNDTKLPWFGSESITILQCHCATNQGQPSSDSTGQQMLPMLLPMYPSEIALPCSKWLWRLCLNLAACQKGIPLDTGRNAGILPAPNFNKKVQLLKLHKLMFLSNKSLLCIFPDPKAAKGSCGKKLKWANKIRVYHNCKRRKTTTFFYWFLAAKQLLFVV